MDFNEAEQKRIQFSTRLRSGQLTQVQFAQALTHLQVTDARGTIWQPNPSGNGWLFWTGSAWQPGTPPGIPGPGMATGTGLPRAPAKDFNEFKSSLMTVDEFKKMSKDVPLAKRPQKWWDLLSILGGVVAAILWFIYGGIRSSREGFDLITPLLMIAIPIILVWFRADIDKMLQPLQPHRKKISKIILIGLGIAVPFLTAWLLYNLFHISQYPLMQANMIVGTFAAYMITRDPQPGPGSKAPRSSVAGSAMIIFTIMICSCIVAPALADDCASDPLNAQDCLRTNGYAEAMAGLIATILASLINGPIIIQSVVQGAAGAGAGVQPPAPPGGPYIGDKKEYTDERGVQREAVLQADGHWQTDEGTWVDFDRLDEAKKQYQDNKAWSADEQAKQIAADTAKADADRKALEAIRAAREQAISDARKELRNYLEWKQKQDQGYADMYKRHADGFTTLINTAEKTVVVADFGVNVLEKMVPGGKAIKTGYTIIKNVGKNVSASNAKGESLWKGVVKGGLEAGYDLGFDALKKKLPSGPGNWEFKGSTTDAIKGLTDGLKSATQSLGVKTIVKDPIKDLMKSGSDKLLGNMIGTYK